MNYEKYEVSIYTLLENINQRVKPIKQKITIIESYENI